MVERRNIDLAGLDLVFGLPVACQLDKTIWTAVLPPIDRDTGKIPESSEEQARCLLANMAAVVARAGGDLGNVGLIEFRVAASHYRPNVIRCWKAEFSPDQSRPVLRIVVDTAMPKGTFVMGSCQAVLD